MSSSDLKGDVEQQRDAEPAGRGTRKVLIACVLVLCVAIGIGIGIGIGAGIWKDGSSSTTPVQGDLEALFRRVDGNQDGSISVDELAAEIAATNGTLLNATDIEKMASLLDSDGNGVVSREEFLDDGDHVVEAGLVDLLFSGCGWDGCPPPPSETCVPRDSGDDVRIILKTIRRETEVNLPTSATVADLKSKAQNIEGVPPDRQHLKFADKQLEDGRTIAFYDIKDCSIVSLFDRKLGG